MTGKNSKAKKAAPVTKENAVSRTFTYRKNNVTLAFTLRTDVKTELSDFIDCMEVALVDVREELAK